MARTSQMRARAASIAVTLIVLTATAMAAAPAAHAAPQTRVVCAEGGAGCAFASIQQAVDASAPGDTVVVRPGTYAESVGIGVRGITVCSTGAGGAACDPDAAGAIVTGADGASGVLTVAAPDVTVRGFTLDLRGSDAVASAVVGAPDVTLRDNVLVGPLRLAAGLSGTTVDARLNDWHAYAWRAVAERVLDLGAGNTVLQIPFRMPDGSIEPPTPRIAGSATHSGTAANCDGWDADGDGFADSFTSGSSCVYLMVQSAIDFAHPGTTIVIPASGNTIDPTPRFETLHIDLNNHGQPLVGGGVVSGGSAQELDGLTLCAGVHDGSNVEPPSPDPSATCATGTDVVLARQGVIIEGGRTPISQGGTPSGDTVIDIGAVAGDVSIQNLTIQWSGSPDNDFAPSSDVTGIAAAGDGATIEGNLLRLQGGGCSAADIAGGGCYSPAKTNGIFADDAALLSLTGNVIRGDLPHPEDGTIGGTNGFFGSAPQGLIEGNLFAGWASHGAIPFGSGVEVSSNAFLINSEGLAFCTTGSGAPLTAEGNVFVAHAVAVAYTNGCSASDNSLLKNNTFNLTNATALHMRPNAGGGTVPAECNDWGVYRSELITERILDERAGGLDVDFQPWTAPVGSDPNNPLCLLGPLALFTTNLHDSGENSENDPPTAPEATRYEDVEFADLSQGNDGRPIIEWHWDFGGEATETISAPASDGSTSYRFTTAGLKTVTLTVTDADGLTSVTSLDVLVTGCTTAGPANTIRVPEIPANFCTIADAVAAAGAGDHVLLTPGETYFESGVVVPDAGLTICRGNAGLTACGAPPATTTLDGDSDTPGQPFFIVTASDVTIEGLTFGDNDTPAGDIADGGSGAPGLTIANASFDTSAAGVILDQSPTDTTITDSSFTGGSSSTLVRLFGATGTNTIKDGSFTGCQRCIQVEGGAPEVTDNVVEASLATTPTHGIRIEDTAGVLIEGNDVTGNIVGGGGAAHGIDLADSTGGTIADNTIDRSAVGLRLGNTSGALVTGNTVTSPRASSTGAGTYGASLLNGSDNTFRDNTLDGAASGIRNDGSVGTRYERDVFTNVETGIVLLGASVDPTSNVARGVRFGGAQTAIRFDAGLSDVIMDARLNDWGVYDHRLLASRVDDDGTDNIALQLPFLLANGTIEPPLPSSAPASHSGTPAICNAYDSDGDTVPDAEFVDGACRFLTVQAAIDFAHGGGRVTVPTSLLGSPTPWFESLAIGANNEGDPLTGLTACATVVVGACEPVSDPARFGIFSSATWGTPPVPHQGQAIRMATGGSTSLFTRTFDGVGAPKISDLTGLATDIFVETGGCPSNDPRLTLRIDTNLDGAADLDYHVYPPNSFTCPVGTWTRIDYLSSTNWGGKPGVSKTQANSNLGPNHRIISMNLIWDGSPTKVAWIDNQRYQNAFFREPGDACDGDASNPTCARETAQAATVLDATGIAPTGVDIDAANVTLRSFTVRRTRPPSAVSVAGIDISGTSGVVLDGNAVRMEGGGGCSAPSATCSSTIQTNGIVASPAASAATIKGNLISGTAASTDGSVGGYNGIKTTLTGASVIEGNTISKWAANGALITGSGPILRDNTFTGNIDGVRMCASGGRITGNDFFGQVAAVVGCQTGTGLVMRDNNMDLGNDFAVRFPNTVAGVTIDGRLNYWGVNNATLLPLRVLDAGGTNRVLQTPFHTAPV